MFISLGTSIGIAIALGTSIFLLIITTYANYLLLKENRFVKTRLQAWRKSCQHTHVKVPF